MEIEIIKVLVYGFSVILVALFVYITALVYLSSENWFFPLLVEKPSKIWYNKINRTLEKGPLYGSNYKVIR